MPDAVAAKGSWTGSILAGFIVALLFFTAGFVVLDASDSAYNVTNLLLDGVVAVVASAAFAFWLRTR